MFVFIFYYEFLWKKIERQSGKNLLSMIFEPSPKNSEKKNPQKEKKSKGPNWNDWKYRIWVELHRKSSITADEAASAGGVHVKQAERYLDKLESDGKVQQAGDSARGIFYKVSAE
ncbi:MAG: hypothetical protein A2827_02335 [Candidatus Spechtbacteria bacterium RIFCSPHIGHO2_01_FULL_43_30]|uniref:Uncharacterized protein n=1 Tax=Candidatus Spechtbacteria bacterium RIFCSPHIGHO2_01_FULL_43_30 TaxID=1802158 RepID=A0A1G2H6Y8_9BACT|nr:MAG: hypothetical protein A2827_02335 [Candidatus Spechtbacteria bacterium RIFCSPHIGHO2_01_FULL_43_30]